MRFVTPISKGKLLLPVVLAAVIFTSCNVTRSHVYFKDLERDTTLTGLITAASEKTIQSGDLLNIVISTLSPETAGLYNAPPNSDEGEPGFLVDEDGYIEVFKAGKVEAAGMTKIQLSKKLQEVLVPFVGQNVVSVDIKNNRHVTMMGGISPKVLPLTEKMTLLDALAESGDITERGRIDNILVIRSGNGGEAKTFKRIDLNDQSVFYSPYYYLQPDDIVYVEPKKPRMQTVQYITLATSIVTFIFFTIDRITRIR